MFFTSCWEHVNSFAACRHFVGEVGTGRIPQWGRGAGVRGLPGLGWLLIATLMVTRAWLPGPVSPVQGAAWMMLPDDRAQLVPDLQRDQGTWFHISEPQLLPLSGGLLVQVSALGREAHRARQMDGSSAVPFTGG